MVLSNRLVSSVKNNVGRGLNIALVNGKTLILHVLADYIVFVFLAPFYGAVLTFYWCIFAPGVTGELLETKTFDMWAGGNKNQTLMFNMLLISCSPYTLAVTTHKLHFRSHLMLIFRCFWPVEVSPASSRGNTCVCSLLWWCSYKVRICVVLPVPPLSH